MVQSELHIRGNISFSSAKVQTNFFVRMETSFARIHRILSLFYEKRYSANMVEK